MNSNQNKDKEEKENKITYQDLKRMTEEEREKAIESFR